MLSDFSSWFGNHWALSAGVMAAWVVALVVCLWVVHRFLITIPPDYFSEHHPRLDRWRDLHPALRWAWLVGKNLIGGVLIVAGIIMLVTPGQGILTLLLGLSLVDLPGKRALERRIVERPTVLKVINQMRIRAGREPLRLGRPSAAG